MILLQSFLFESPTIRPLPLFPQDLGLLRSKYSKVRYTTNISISRRLHFSQWFASSHGSDSFSIVSTGCMLKVL